jgi:hypothetical protein
MQTNNTASAWFIPAIVACVLCCALGTVGGVLVVKGLDWLAPRYYPGVSPPFMDSYAGSSYAGTYAIVTGIEQGVLIGSVVGVVVATGLAWFRQTDLASIVRAFALIAVFGLVFGLGGLGVGYCMGTIHPNYYERTFNASQKRRDFNPVDVGMGLGCSEGLMVGFPLGAMAAVMNAWFGSRRARKRPQEFDQHPYERSMSADSR